MKPTATGQHTSPSRSREGRRGCGYDAAGRLTTRSISRQGSTRNDTFAHNSRSELTAATLGADAYVYDYDNIGNCAAAVENSSGVASRTEYQSNNLNQYTEINDFTPEYDLDGNQTRIKTSTGIWLATYKAPEGPEGDWTNREARLPRRSEQAMGCLRVNALNRPVRFESEDGSIVITADYDYMGRRVFKKVENINEGTATTTSHLRFLYRGYLQIAALDLTQPEPHAQWFITWDVTQPVATRPLAIQKDGTWFAYGWDLTKNICEVYGNNGYIRTTYSYTPYGAATAVGDVEQSIQWSSEFNDTELGLVYYNYRHYNPVDGRWIGRDKIGEREDFLLYKMAGNNPILNMDIIGNAGFVKIACCAIAAALSIWKTYDTLSGELCIGETGSDYVKCMLANVIKSALGGSTLATVTCCVLRNLEKGDVNGARLCVQDEINGIIRDLFHITALTCCVGPKYIMEIGRTVIDGVLQSVRNTSPQPCCVQFLLPKFIT